MISLMKKTLSYKDAGVDVEQANALVKNIRQMAARTRRPGVIGHIGHFGACFEVPSHYKQPVLVSGTDGVGTKLKLAIAMNKHDTIGIDLVAMCVNDIACLGAEPLFFLDYFATGHLNNEQAMEILSGISKGCELAGAALIGGETAEMPGIYQNEDYDLAGFCVGVVEKPQIIDGSKIQVGDALIAIASSGPHSNGYSLIRRILETSQTPLNNPFGHSTIGETLLTPTKIYIPILKALQKSISLHAIAHITGGGMVDKLTRVLPPNTQAIIDGQSWQWPEIFQWLQDKGGVNQEEMLHTFNLGIGMVLCINKKDVDLTLDLLKALNEKAWLLGHIGSYDQQTPRIQLNG